jgi:hypothetical protein
MLIEWRNDVACDETKALARQTRSITAAGCRRRWRFQSAHLGDGKGHEQKSEPRFNDDTIEPEEAESLQFFRDFQGKLSEKDWKALRGMAEALKSKDAE